MSEAHGFDARLDLELPGVTSVAWHESFHSVIRGRPAEDLEIRMTVEDLICQPDDPPTAFTDFTIWDGAKIGPERASERPEYVFGALEWNAADEKKFFGHVVTPLAPGSHVLFGRL
jgi:hypothetical protein